MSVFRLWHYRQLQPSLLLAVPRRGQQACVSAASGHVVREAARRRRSEVKPHSGAQTALAARRVGKCSSTGSCVAKVTNDQHCIASRSAAAWRARFVCGSRGLMSPLIQLLCLCTSVAYAPVPQTSRAAGDVWYTHEVLG